MTLRTSPNLKDVWIPSDVKTKLEIQQEIFHSIDKNYTDICDFAERGGADLSSLRQRHAGACACTFGKEKPPDLSQVQYDG